MTWPPGNGAVALVAWTELRRRWVMVVAVGLLFGLAGGIGLACLAGARRTDTVFERHLAASDAADIEIDPGGVTPEVEKAIRSLPGVTSAHYWVTYNAFRLDARGGLDESLQQGIVFTSDGRYIDDDRLATTAGRRLDSGNPHEVMVNEAYAKAAGVHVGSTFDLGVVEADENGVPVSFDPPADPLQVTVVGIMVLNEEITSEEIDVIPRLFVSPAARVKPIGDPGWYGYSWFGLQVQGGQDAVARVEAAWDARAEAHNAEGDAGNRQPWLSYVRRSSDLERKADRAIRPLVTTLAAFGLLVLLAATVLVGQSLGREIRSRREDSSITRILGLTPSQSLVASLAVPFVAILISGATAAVAAVAGSLAFPLGPFAVLEPSKGLAIDLFVLIPGLLLVVLLPILMVAVTAWREVRTSARFDGVEGAKIGGLAGLAGRTGGSPAFTAALRLTFDPGRGRRFVPTRSMLVSIVITVVALVTVLVFGRNLQALSAQPDRFGWPSDGALASDGGYSPFDQDATTKFLDGSTDIDIWRFAGAGLVSVGSERVPAIVLGPGDRSFAPKVLEGAPPQAPGEVVLGAQTMRRLGTKVGASIIIGAGNTARKMRVTGTAVFPVLGPVLAARTGLDEGVWLDQGDYTQIGSIASSSADGAPAELQFSFVLFDLTPRGTLDHLTTATTKVQLSTGSGTDVLGVIRPSEVQTAAAGGGRTQLILAGVLALAAGMSTVLALAAVVRRRRRELAVYRVLGFSPGQVRSTLLLQGLIMMGVGVVIGIPAGLALGRTTWRVFAGRLGVVPDPLVPTALLGLVALAAVVVGVLGAVGPAIAAARVPPAVGVRTE